MYLYLYSGNLHPQLKCNVMGVSRSRFPLKLPKNGHLKHEPESESWVEAT